MDGVPIDRRVVGRSAQSLSKALGDRVRPLLKENESDSETLVDELRALLHGMVTLYLNRFAPFDLTKVTAAVVKLVSSALTKPADLNQSLRN